MAFLINSRLYGKLYESHIDSRLYGNHQDIILRTTTRYPFSGTIQYSGDKRYDDPEVGRIAKYIQDNLRTRFMADTGINVTPANLPEGQRDTVLETALKKNAKEPYDVVTIDTVKIPYYAESLMDIGPFFGKGYGSDTDENVKEYLIESNTIGERLVAMPLYEDIGLLYYNKELLKQNEYEEQAPDTWDKLEEQARKIQNRERLKANSDFTAFAWQGWKYEGLTCNALEWIASYGGFDQKTGHILFNSKHGAVVEALNRARVWVKGEGNTAPPISSLSIKYKEDDSLKQFLDGKAVFLRHWPDAYRILERKHVRFGVAQLPHVKNGRSVGVVGGWQLAVPKNSNNPADAIEFIRYLTTKGVQEWRTHKGSYMPIYEGIKFSEDSGLANIQFSEIEMITRPSNRIRDYNRASECVFKNVSDILKSNSYIEVESVVDKMATNKDCREIGEESQ